MQNVNGFSWSKPEFKAFHTLTVLDPPEEAIAALKSAPLDWDRCAAFAIATRAPFIFYSNVKRHGLQDRFSPAVIEKLEGARRGVLQNGIFWTRQLHEVLAAFAAEQIDVMPLKGMSLFLNTYQNEALRKTVDLDLFIDVKNFGKCRRVLEGLKYQSGAVLVRGVMKNYGQESVFLRSDRAEVDLHYRLFSWHEEKLLYGIDSSQFFERAVRSSWKGLPVRFMKADDELYYLLLTIFSECYRNFKYYLDVDSLARKRGNEIDWAALERRIAESPLAGYLAGILDFMEKNLKTPFPSGFMENLPDVMKHHHRFAVPEDSDIIADEASMKDRQFFYFMAARGASRFRFIVIFLKWQIFKMTGCFASYFRLRNGPFDGGLE